MVRWHQGIQSLAQILGFFVVAVLSWGSFFVVLRVEILLDPWSDAAGRQWNMLLGICGGMCAFCTLRMLMYSRSVHAPPELFIAVGFALGDLFKYSIVKVNVKELAALSTLPYNRRSPTCPICMAPTRIRSPRATFAYALCACCRWQPVCFCTILQCLASPSWLNHNPLERIWKCAKFEKYQTVLRLFRVRNRIITVSVLRIRIETIFGGWKNNRIRMYESVRKRKTAQTR